MGGVCLLGDQQLWRAAKVTLGLVRSTLLSAPKTRKFSFAALDQELIAVAFWVRS